MITDRIVEQLVAACQRHGFAWFDSEPPGDRIDLNLVTIRRTVFPGLPAGQAESDHFDDLCLAVYRAAGDWRMHSYPITSDPGRRCLLHPYPQGAGILAHPQQARGVYRPGDFHGPALRQRGSVPFLVWRDVNRDAVLDYPPLSEATPQVIGAHLHRAAQGRIMRRIGGHSYACQVTPLEEDCDAIVALARRNGARTTYTIVGEEDLAGG